MAGHICKIEAASKYKIVLLTPPNRHRQSLKSVASPPNQIFEPSASPDVHAITRKMTNRAYTLF